MRYKAPPQECPDCEVEMVKREDHTVTYDCPKCKTKWSCPKACEHHYTTANFDGTDRKCYHCRTPVTVGGFPIDAADPAPIPAAKADG